MIFFKESKSEKKNHFLERVKVRASISAFVLQRFQFKKMRGGGGGGGG